MIRHVKWLYVVVLAVGLTACRPDPTGPFDLPGQGRRSSDEKNFLDPGTFPYNRIESGGVPKDGIPALTDPVRVSAGSSEADYLRDVDLVMGVVINGEAVAYPHNIGWHHEIVNDVVGGQPIVVSFCPLTGTGLVFNGLGADGSRLTCGVSGLLFNNNLIMYDRRDDKTLYPQMIHKGINELWLNQELELLPVVETTWRMWKQLYPETQVVGGFTGIFGPGQYTLYPYGGYRSANASPLFRIFPSTGSNPIGE